MATGTEKYAGVEAVGSLLDAIADGLINEFDWDARFEGAPFCLDMNTVRRYVNQCGNTNARDHVPYATDAELYSVLRSTGWTAFGTKVQWVDPDAWARCALYRWFDEQGRLLYVGISVSPLTRQSQHQATSAWYPRACAQSLEWFSSRHEAHIAEIKAIHTENPLFNKERYANVRTPA